MPPQYLLPDCGLATNLIARRLRVLDHGDLVVFQESSLRPFKCDDRLVVGRLVLGLVGNGGGVLAHAVVETINRDPALLKIVMLSVQSSGRSVPEPRRRRELPIVRLDEVA